MGRPPKRRFTTEDEILLRNLPKNSSRNSKTPKNVEANSIANKRRSTMDDVMTGETNLSDNLPPNSLQNPKAKSTVKKSRLNSADETALPDNLPQNSTQSSQKVRGRRYSTEECNLLLLCCNKFHETINKNSSRDFDQKNKEKAWHKIQKDLEENCKAVGIPVSS